MIVLDYRDRSPLYEQIAERFQALIVKGILPKDMQMPSVRSQAMQLSINPNTIQRAYSELERQGYIYSIKGKGSFVADISEILDKRRTEWSGRMTALAEEGYSLGVSREQMEEIIRNAEALENAKTSKNAGNSEKAENRENTGNSENTEKKGGINLD